MLKILNLGCGTNLLKSTKNIEYINVDMLKLKGIVRHNLTKMPYPFEDMTFDKIILSHTIEHIPEDKHPLVLCECRRILKIGGQIAISYPEFTKVAKNYLENKNGEREYWKATIYGRGQTEWDRHKALMDTPYFLQTLGSCGLKPVKVYSENREIFNTVVICEKTEPTLTHEELAMIDIGS